MRSEPSRRSPHDSTTLLGRLPFARVAQGAAVLLAALASVATSSPDTGTFGAAEAGAPVSSGVVSMTDGSPSTTVDLTLSALDSSRPVLTIAPADPIDQKLTPNGAPFPAEFVTVTLLTPNGSSPAGKGVDVTPTIIPGSNATTYTLPMADAIGRGCLCPTSPAPACDPGADAGASDDGSAADGASAVSTDAGCGIAPAVDAGCDTCNARVRLTFLLPTGFTSLNVGYNLYLTQGTVASP